MPPLAQAPLWRMILDATIFGVTGIVLLILGYYIWELVTPYNLRRELQDNKNVAVAVVAASFVLGMAIVVAAALMRLR
jgi:putative membrane protein